MNIYRVVAVVTISVHTDVEADDVETARDLAMERPLQGLCYQCSVGNTDNEWSLSGELDGEPKILEGEEIQLDEKKKRKVK